MIRGAAHKVAHLVVNGVVYVEAPGAIPKGGCKGCAAHDNPALCLDLGDCLPFGRAPIIFIERAK